MAVNLVRMTKRLQQIRVALAYTVEEAGKATGLDVHRLLSIESGDATPTGDEILILASLYDCDFRTLIDEALPPPAQQTDILFRRYGDAFTPEDRRAIQEFLHLCQIEASLERQLGLVNEAVHFEWSGTLFKAHGQQVAEALRTRLGYSDNEAPRDIYSDFRRIGIHIFRRKLVNNEISGLYIEDPVAGHCVLINYNEDIYRQRFSVAHEVAHAIFDSSEGMMLTFQPNSARYDKNELKEIRANSFASHYLMPLTMLRRIPKVDESSAPEWAQKFRVSTAALAKALRDANLIDENMGKQIRGARVPRNEKIDPEAPENLTEAQKRRRLDLLERGLSSHYVNLCFKAHDQGDISAGRLAEVLRVEYADLADIGMLFGRTIGHGI
ncbi:MAG: helix-turn-helix domain-containing protein [Acidithiobacillus sp.]